MSAPRKLLSLDTPWAIGEDAYNAILHALSGRQVEQILEFGSGRSTVRISQDFPGAQVVSVEDHEEHYRETMRLLAQHEVQNVTVLLCPLGWMRIGLLRWYFTYSLKPECLPSEADFVLIDGPVESRTLRGREAPLYVIFPLISDGGVIALDDYSRDSAKAVVSNWLNSYRGNLKILAESEDLILLEKCGHQRHPAYPGLGSIWDNISVCMQLVSIRKKMREVLKKLIDCSLPRRSFR